MDDAPVHAGDALKKVRTEEPANSDDEEASASQDARVIADKLPLTLDKNGAGKVTIDNVPQSRQPQELLLEATYADPNGEVQTLRSTQTLWPAGVVAGIKTEGWVSARQKIRFQALALQHNGKPAADAALQVQAVGRRLDCWFEADQGSEEQLNLVLIGRSPDQSSLAAQLKSLQA